jgi:hypothetical protein
MHGRLYKKEYNYGIEFETYVAAGLVEFYQHRIPLRIVYGSVNTEIKWLVSCYQCIAEKQPSSAILFSSPDSGELALEIN